MKAKPPNIKAKQLLELLATRHCGDVFIPECKTGPTHYSTMMQRMDAWAMKKSWAHPLTIAYEIKVARGDFLADNKWRGYLPYCNQFVFVAPPGLIEVDEVPRDAGLLVCSRNASRLYQKKKAPYREVDIPESLYRYILFSRVRITREFSDDGNGAEFWREWLAGKQELAGLGNKVSRALRKRISDEIDLRDTTQHALEREIEHLTDAKTLLVNLGFAPGHIPPEWSVKNKLAVLKHAVPPDTLRAVRKAKKALEMAEKVLLDIDNSESGRDQS